MLPWQYNGYIYINELLLKSSSFAVCLNLEIISRDVASFDKLLNAKDNLPVHIRNFLEISCYLLHLLK
jgi:hypothetical protein